MTLNIKVSLFLIFVSISGFTQAIVLQQGANGYSGCKDSYIDHSNYGTSKETNFGDSDTIFTDICYS